MKDTLAITGPEPSGEKEGSPSGRERAMERTGIPFSPSEKLLPANIPAEQFAVSGISRDGLSAWKDAAAVILLIWAVFIGGACRTAFPPGYDTWEKGKGPGCGKIHESDIDAFDYGWCDEDTFRIKSVGAPSAKETVKEQRRETAHKAAVLTAQYQALGKFQGARIENGPMMPDGYWDTHRKDQEKFDAEAKVFIKTGTVLAAKWDDRENCTIVYQLRKTGLKKWVLGCEKE